MNRRSKLGAVLALSIAATAVAVPATAADTPPSPVDRPGYTLDFQEEFSGTALDRSKWMTRYLPHWTDTPADTEARYSIANGVLTQRIDRDQPLWDADVHPELPHFKSSTFQTYNANHWHKYKAGLTNHDTPKFDGYKTRYGYFEIRAKMSNAGGGGHQAWWLVGTDDTSPNSANPEIDIIESFFSTPGTWNIAAHSWTDPDFLPGGSVGHYPAVSGSPTTEFHKYAMDWTPTQLRFYYDDVLKATINDAPNMPMAMILNIYTGVSSGNPNDVWPKQWQVDYLRVWKKREGYGEAYSTVTNRWKEGQRLHVEGRTGLVQAGVVPATYWSAQWERETNAEGYVRYRNRLTGEFVDTWDTTGVRSATTSARWWSSQFTEVPVAGTPYVRLKNRHHNDYLHIQDLTGNAQRGNVPAGYWSSQWLIQPAP